MSVEKIVTDFQIIVYSKIIYTELKLLGVMKKVNHQNTYLNIGGVQVLKKKIASEVRKQHHRDIQGNMIVG